MHLLPTQDLVSYFGPIAGEAQLRATLATRLPMAQTQLWSTDRIITALEQILINHRLSTTLNYRALKVDGLAGPSTLYALELYHNWSRDNPVPVNNLTAARPIYPLQKDVPSFYGKAGSPACQARTPTLPYPFRMDGSLSPTGKAHMKHLPAPASTISHFALHERLHDSILSILSQVLAHYGQASIEELGLDQYAGSYNYRPMRGGTNLSMHAFGVAIDFDAQRNSLHETRSTARFARPEYRPFVDAFYDHGWISLGRERDFDWMHFQAARLS